MDYIPPSAFHRPPPPRRRNEGSVSDPHSNMLSKETNTSISRGKSLCMNPKTPTYYDQWCRKAMATNIDSLTDDLLFDILLLLPADFLYDKARLVCHKWYNIIHSHDFINKQIHYSSYGLLISSFSHERIHPIYVTTSRGQIQTTQLSYKCRGTISACCNGLIVESQREENEAQALLLINPTTRQPFLLPSYYTHNITNYVEACGIAYSAASMEYKVTLPYIFHDNHYNPIPWGQRLGVVIVSVGVDKSWRKVKVRHLPPHVRELLCRTPRITEGFMHWTRDSYVLTLNVETEVFTYNQVPLPPPPPQEDKESKSYHYLSTGKFLSLVVGGGDFLFEIWEMKPESGEWRNLMPLKIEMRPLESARRPNERLIPLGWVKYAKVLAFSVRGRGGCIFYNLDTHETNTIELPEHCQGLPHRNNLVWLG